MEFSIVVAACFAAISLVLVSLNRRQSSTLAQFKHDILLLQAELSERKSLLQLASARMSALMSAAYDALLVIDGQRHLIMINESARQLFNVKDDPIGKTLMSVTKHYELDAVADELFRGGEILENQITLDNRALRVRGLRVSVANTDALVLALQDVSELLRLSRARRDMVANFSHDLRTPVSNIRLLVDKLLLTFGRNPERDKVALSKIASETDSLQHMTEELIDLSMIESGKVIIRMVVIAFGEIAHAALEMMGTQIDQKKISLINEIPSDLRVLADPDQTRRVITNIIHNAVKFTPNNGQIRITAGINELMATIRIADTGPGIPPQERERIFERFYQVDSSRTGQNGSGLGLSIAKHIVEAQGGKIWAEQAIPQGAVICFTLPLAEKSAT